MRLNPITIIAGIVTTALAAMLVAGPLTPPAGPIAGTYKTLSEVEARTPISSLPFTITQPGSYYLARNLANTNTAVDSIAIQSPNVTLDLNGFVLAGGRAGILVNAGAAGGGVTIVNGTIRDAAEGINADAFGSGGSIALVVRDVRFQQITATAIRTQRSALIERCAFRGFGTAVVAGVNSIVRECIASGGSAVGFDLTSGSAVDRSIASFLGLPGSGVTGFLLRAGASASNVIVHNIPAPTLGINSGVSLSTGSTLRDSTIFSTHYGVIAAGQTRVDGGVFHALSGIGYSVTSSVAGAVLENSVFTAFDNLTGVGSNTTGCVIRNNVVRGTTANPNPNSNVGVGMSITPGASATITNNIIGNIYRGVVLQSGGNTVHSNSFHLVGSTVSNFAAGSAPPAGNLLGPVNSAAAATTSQNPLVSLLF